MAILKELRERRVLPYVSAYVVAGWGLVQFVAFLEDRLLLSPHLVNLIAVGLVMLLPSVAILAWCHGRPGTDRWGRSEKISIPVNLVAATVLLAVMFSDKDLGAVTETIEVRDENGAVSERQIPKDQYRSRAMVYYFGNTGDPEDDWLRQGLTNALVADISQDTWVEIDNPITRIANLRRAGHPDGLDLPRPLMRRIAREAHIPQFVVGSFARGEGGITLEFEVHATKTGRVVASHTVGPGGLYAIVDEASLLIRREFGLPASHIETQEDLPVADILTEDQENYRFFSDAVTLVVHANDWEGAGPLLERAVELDPGFAAAHFMRYAVLLTLGDEAGGNAAMASAIEHLYRMPERSQFQVKALYYFNVKQDPDKAMAVVDMWTRLYPNDVAAYQQIATFAFLRQDHEAAVGALENILEIDPTRHDILPQLADIYSKRAEFATAASYLEHYAELNPMDARSFIQLADLHLEAGDLKAARLALEQAQLVEPDRPETLRELAGIDRRLGRFAEAEEALAALRDGAANDDDRMAALTELFFLHRTQGRWRLARAELVDRRELGRSSISPVQAHLNYAILLAEVTAAGFADSALAELVDLRRELGSPNDRLVGMCEASVLLRQGRLEAAEVALAESEALVDEFKLEVIRPLILGVAADQAEARGDLKAGLDLHRRALELDPTSQRHLRSLAYFQRLTGQMKDATATLTRALKHSPGHPEPNLEMALLLESDGRSDEARPYLERALAAWRQADPDFPNAAAARELAAGLNAIQ